MSLPHVTGRPATLRVLDPAGPLLSEPRGELLAGLASSMGAIACGFLRGSVFAVLVAPSNPEASLSLHCGPMGVDPSSAAAHFERFARQVLAPAVYTHAMALEAGVLQSAEPISYEEAAAGEYTPVRIGWEWGPVWSTAWFRVRGAVARALAGRRVVLRFSTGTEALLWRDGQPWHGLDLNRDAVELFPRASEGAPVDLLIEAACNHHLGQLGTQWDSAEFLARWQTEKPARLARCELAALDETAWRLHWAYVFAVQLMRELPATSARAQELAGALRAATGVVDADRVNDTAGAALAIVEGVLGRGAAPSATVCHAVGHAHIDTAWLWPIRETKRKCLRTFATALANLERFPEFRFLCSQAQQYAWVEEEAPGLFARIRERVMDGRWEPGGAMWIEPDCNLVSGESLVRQIVHGTRYWRSRFGERGAQRYVYLPDTFGFTPALPQIMRLAGLETFITHKLSWNDTNRWAHTHFVWRGLDGSEVVAHMMPGHDYNLTMTPRELRRGEQNHENKDLVASVSGAGAIPARYVQPFGYGDGGGGPTDWQILNGELARECEGLPRVRFSRVDEFCAALHAEREALRRSGVDFPVWEGELYLEAHRGTYTTQAWIKTANRRLEEDLRSAEILTWAGPSAPDGGEVQRLRGEQDAAWKTLLLNQFHDIIPGSSIGWVYKDAGEQLARVRETVDAHAAKGMERLGSRLSTAGLAKPVMVYNATSVAQSGVVEHGGELLYVEDVPALGARAIDASKAVDSTPASGPARFVGELRMTNGRIEVQLDAGGNIVSLRRCGSSREIAGAGGSAPHFGALMLYEDHPRNWDAWDIDPEYERHGRAVVFEPAGVQIEEMGPLRVRIVRRAKVGARSSVTQEYVLHAGSPRLDVRTTVDWRESHRFLRALFPTSIRAAKAVYECAFGFVERSTGRQTSWERARFEVPGRRWMSISDEDGAGVAILNDSKYGHSCHEGVIGLSLLRAPKFPDETADMGVHRFTYSVMPHDGDWRAARVVGEAELLNAPLRTWSLPTGQAGELGAAWAPIEVRTTGGGRATVAAFKIAEEDDRLILRLVETHGREGATEIKWNLGVREVAPVNLLEEACEASGWSHSPETGVTTLELRPFQIVTLAARRV